MDDDPKQRRMEDGPAQGNQQLILYQLGEVKAAIREGFQRMEARFDRVEDRLSALERFRERVEQRDRTEAEASTTGIARWGAVMVGLGITASIVLGILGLLHG